MNEIRCCICECKDGEEGRILSSVQTEEGIFPICQVCTEVSTRYFITKCRICGSVATVPINNTPNAFLMQGWSAIVFALDCKFCGGQDVREMQHVH